MDNNEFNINDNNMSTLQEFIEDIISNEEMKTKFIETPDDVMKEYELNESQKLLLKSLDAEDILKLNPENVEEYFSADSAVYTPEIDDELLSGDEQGEDDIL